MAEPFIAGLMLFGPIVVQPEENQNGGSLLGQGEWVLGFVSPVSGLQELFQCTQQDSVLLRTLVDAAIPKTMHG